MKKCPFCGEAIQDAAVKCKHCKEWLSKRTEMQNGATTQSQKLSAPRPATGTKSKTETFAEDSSRAVKNNNRAHWFGILVGGVVAGLSVKMLNTNGIYLGFFPAGIFWFACYWIVRKIAQKLCVQFTEVERSQ